MRFQFQQAEERGRRARFYGKKARACFRKLVNRPRVEILESRRLLSVVVNEYSLSGGPIAQGIVSGSDGNLWFTEPNAARIVEINPSTHAVTGFPVPTANGSPEQITEGPDDNLWFTEADGNKIGRFNLTTHIVTEFPVPTANSFPVGITTGPDGNLWFTEERSNRIGEINPTTHAISDFPTPTSMSNPLSITTGPDGNLWFTESNRVEIGRINPTTHVITEFPINQQLAPLGGITAGPDGNLWFADAGSNSIGRINPTTQAITLFPITATARALPNGITAGPAGNLWFTEQLGNNVGEINPATGAITEFPVPTSMVEPEEITAGPDGNLWFTEMGYIDFNLANYPSFSNIGQVVIAAAHTSDLALSGAAPSSIASGSNVTYSLTVKNNGSGDATGVKLTDTLPMDVTFVSATGGVTPSSNMLTFTIGTLASGASTNLSIVVTPNVPGNFTDTAQVVMDQYDPTPNDNNVTLSTNVTSAGADLALSGTPSPNPVNFGNNLTYTLTVKNEGGAEATGVKLTDSLPSGVTFVSATGGVMPDPQGNLTFALPNLAPGATTTVTIVVTGPQETGTKGQGLTDYARVSMDQTDPTPADNSTTVYATAFGESGTGCRGQTTVLLLKVPDPADAAWAQNINDYRLVDLNGSRRTVLLKSARYDAATGTVTLKPLHQQNLHRLYELTVIGAGGGGQNAGATGPTDDQAGSGGLGGNLVILITIADLIDRGTSPASVRNYNLILHAQRLEMKRLGLE
jgi:virginiamycin B lyase